MAAINNYFQQLIHIAQQRHHRFGVVLSGESDWQDASISQLCQAVKPESLYLLGGSLTLPATKSVKFAKGQQLLGQECELLVCDFRDGFDANSFSAATGCVKGGGLVVVLSDTLKGESGYDAAWLDQSLQQLLVIEQGSDLPALPSIDVTEMSPFEQQGIAVEKIIKVVEGHRKRPLVMTADRGRGKSSALGIAAAQLMQSRTIHIVLTAPSPATVAPVFEHASRLLPDAKCGKNTLEWQNSILEFVAPDELLKRTQAIDCLFVDEASAIPIPMLKQMVETHHRAVFSTTIHGYEGCGRGFTVRFQAWLKEQRPGSVFYHLDQPIRWAGNDPLETWLFDSFLLNADLVDAPGSVSKPNLSRIDKKTLVEQPKLLRSCFALLVNAHYQTSPNDLMLLLSDPAIELYVWQQNGQCLGCILTVEEGNLSPELINDVQLGKRRPRGHLVPIVLAGQIGIEQAATQSSLRVMRIAIHPQLQNIGYGQQILRQLQEVTDFDFYSTSFGATPELVAFWKSVGFQPVRLGSQRDQASGTHSLVMVLGSNSWSTKVCELFQQSFHYALSEGFRQLEIELVRSLLGGNNASVENSGISRLVEFYSLGGSSFDSVAPILDEWWKQAPDLANQLDDLFIRKVIQRWDWAQCAKSFNYSGRKQTEQALRNALQPLL
ncbi:ATPase [Vibrio xuii]|nr:ATPase [Vibrio xuii]